MKVNIFFEFYQLWWNDTKQVSNDGTNTFWFHQTLQIQTRRPEMWKFHWKADDLTHNYNYGMKIKWDSSVTCKYQVRHHSSSSSCLVILVERVTIICSQMLKWTVYWLTYLHKLWSLFILPGIYYHCTWCCDNIDMNVEYFRLQFSKYWHRPTLSGKQYHCSILACTMLQYTKSLC